MFDFGILGMNARNLQYIKKFNPAKAIRLADNKFKTKRFLGDRGIPVPDTYDLIKTREQLYQYDFTALPHDDFIVKPVRGSRGRGIYRVKIADTPEHVSYLDKLSTFDQFFTKHSPYIDQWYKVSGEFVDDTTLRRYLVDILDGKNSLTSKHDTIMLEEVLIPGSGFEKYCAYGLADIRIIVFNLIPVAAMLRVPTAQSDGKANLDRGAIGMGVEVGSGRIYAMYKNKKIYTKHFPPEYASFAFQYLPYRDDILSYSSKIQYFANLGYLALDWVITDEGPKLLEINARAGLKFQNASLLPLRRRLNRIKDVRISSPEKGVEIAQTLFTQNKGQVITSSKVLYLRQDGQFHISSAGEKKVFDVVVEVDTAKKRSYLSSGLFSKITTGDPIKHILRIGSKGIKFDQYKWRELETNEKNKVVLGRDAIADYFIKPIEKAPLSLDFINPSNFHRSEIDALHVLDVKLGNIGRVLNLSRILKPTNILEQLDNFITWGGNYNPTFQYRWPANEKLQEIEKELHVLDDTYFGSNGLQSHFALLFKGKLQELQVKLALIHAYKKQDYPAIATGNVSMYGNFDAGLVKFAKEKIFLDQPSDILGRVLSGWELRKRVVEYLNQQGLSNVKVQFDQDSLARMTVSKVGKQMTLKISPKADFREHELRATLAHEVDVHMQRYVNGLHTGRQLLKKGTAGYITDEEGLAVHMSQQYLPAGYERKGSSYRYFFLHQGQEKDFASLASLVRGMKAISLAEAFNDTVRMKKGITDTSVRHPGTLYMKDKIYLDGYDRIEKWIQAGGDKQQLMIGKIKIDDLAYIF